MSLDQSPFATPRENQLPSPTFPPFGSNVAAPSQNFRDTPLPLPSTPNIDPLAIDILAKDFNLEPVQRANLHAFIQVCGLSPNPYSLSLTFQQRSVQQMGPCRSLTC